MDLKQHIGHPHPLVFNEETSNQSEEISRCSGCEGKELGRSFSCAECGFFLHKECAEAPMETQHPFHRLHPLILRLPSSQVEEKAPCNICYRSAGKGYSYCCSSCKITFHINCTLLARDPAGHFIETLPLSHHQHPLFLIDNHSNLLKYRYCSDCSSQLVDASYVCFDCKIFFHKKCVESPKISHPCHRKHLLIPEFAGTDRLCNLCQSEHYGQLFYSCSICNLNFGSECAWPPPVIEDKSHHEHPLTLLLSPNSFTCDACGTEGNYVHYICSTCNIQVHKDCLSLPRFIRINLHHHPISHGFSFSIHRHDSRTWDCRICYKKVNMEHGSYYCSQPDCDFVIHVKCAINEDSKYCYDVIEVENLDEFEESDFSPDESRNLISRVVREIKVGEDAVAAEIIHSSHEHNLTFSNEIMDNKRCNGCVLPIFSSFYYCSSGCDFFLHKACAELPRKTRDWLFRRPFSLLTNGIFECSRCGYVRSGFSYKLDDVYFGHIVHCLRCAALSHSFTYQANEPHFLYFDRNCEIHCSACGSDELVIFRCKDCDFALDHKCVTLLNTAWHKCDKHSLTLVYGDYNDYPLHQYCDICEEERDPKHWFYHCEVCDNAMHPKCVLGEYPFIKPGSKYTHKDHQHPLTLVQKIYDYPLCVKCGKPCQDLTLECVEHDCNFVIHFSCINFSELV